MLRVPNDEYGRNILEKATKLAELALERHGYEGAVQHWTASRDDSAPGTFSHMFDIQVLDEIERLHRETLQ